jgi:hypothetical protein
MRVAPVLDRGKDHREAILSSYIVSETVAYYLLQFTQSC